MGGEENIGSEEVNEIETTGAVCQAPRLEENSNIFTVIHNVLQALALVPSRITHHT